MHSESSGTSRRQPLKGIFLGEDPVRVSAVWTPQQRAKLGLHIDLLPQILTSADMDAHKEWLEQTDVIFSTWSMPQLSAQQLDRMPNLKAVFYAAGTVRRFAPPLIDRNIVIVSAWAANAIPVAEFTLSQIIFSLKLGWQHLRQMRQMRGPGAWFALDVPGVYNTSVGLISLDVVGRRVCELLSALRLQKFAYDPLLPRSEFRELDVQPASLKEIFTGCDVVSLHSPCMPQGEGCITGELLASMKPNATFINTCRGALVNHEELISVMRQRTDLTAVLDVTWPEPPPAGSPIYELENIVLTPHIAGSMGNEVLRMSDLMISEFLAWKEGLPLHYSVSREQMAHIA